MMEISKKDELMQNIKLRLVAVLFLINGFWTFAVQWWKYIKREYQNKANNYEIPYDLTGFEAVITGGAGEIGFACVKKLLEKNCHVVIATIPNPGQTFEELESQIEQDLCEVPRKQWELIYLNLSSCKSVNAFADTFLKANRKIDILINNAGVLLMPFGKTEEGFERTMAINYLGHSLLILNLLPVLKPSDGSLKTRQVQNIDFRAKVVNIASHGHRYFEPDLSLLSRVTKEDAFYFSPCYAYSQSKSLIIAFNFFFAQHILPKLDPTVQIINVHPGIVGSKNMVLENKFLKTLMPMEKCEQLAHKFLWTNPDLLLQPPLQVAEHVMFGTFNAEFENLPTVYLESFENVEPSKTCADPQFQRKVYEQTIEMLQPYLNDFGKFVIHSEAQVA